MRLGRHGLTLGLTPLWLAAWGLWLLTGLALPVPPWRVEDVLAREETTALALASSPARAEVWSIDVGAPRQARALAGGWSQNEVFMDRGRSRTFIWIEGDSAEIAFASPGWPAAHLTLDAAPLESLAPLALDVDIDGLPRARLVLPAGWTVSHVSLGSVTPGPHVVRIRPERQGSPPGEVRSLSVAVDGLAIGSTPVPDPDRDRGVFAGWLRIGLEDRPAVFVSADAMAGSLPRGTAGVSLGDLVGWYGFGIGGAAHAASALIHAVHGLLAALLVALLPGAVWTGLTGSRGAARLALSLALSALALLSVFLALRLMGQRPTPTALALGLGVVSGLPLPVLRGRGGVGVPWRRALASAAALATLTVFATCVVPPLEDQDMELQATAHALATRQVPQALTNRGTTYFFAHPPLLHLWQAGSIALSGGLPRVADYEEAARRAQAEPFVEPRPDAPLAERPYYREWTRLLRRFLAEPHLWPTRQVNVLLAALAVGLFAELATSLAGATAGIALSAVLLTFPEFLVRGAYGGYFAATALLSLLLLAELHEGTGADSLLTTGALAFLANQKGLLVGAAWAAGAPLATGFRRLLPLAGGLLGLSLYSAYGLGVSREAFLYDFVKEHVLRRLTPTDVRFAHDVSRFYPSIPELWAEFASRYGWLFLAWAALASLKGLVCDRALPRAAAASVVLGALVFSATDWRQTKHLSLLAAPALLTIAAAWPPSGWGRRLAVALAALLVLGNVATAWPLFGGFEALGPSTLW